MDRAAMEAVVVGQLEQLAVSICVHFSDFLVESLPAKHDTYQIDTTNILFILSGAFVGLENIVRERVIKGVRPLSLQKNFGQ
jgi:ATP-dependent protease Clp ATPase subunit